MAVNLFEELKALGVDVDGGIRRINGNDGLYRKLLGTFVKTIKDKYVQPDFSSEECEQVIERAHTIKGASGNLSITPVFEAYTEILNHLRAGRIDMARQHIEQVIPVQEKIVQCIEQHMD